LPDQPAASRRLCPKLADSDSIAIGVREANLWTPWLFDDRNTELRSDGRNVGNTDIDEPVGWSVSNVFGEKHPRPLIAHQREEGGKGGLESVLPLPLESQPFVPDEGTVSVDDPQHRDRFAWHGHTLPEMSCRVVIGSYARVGGFSHESPPPRALANVLGAVRGGLLSPVLIGVTMKVEVALCLPRDASTLRVTRGVLAAALTELGVTQTCLEEIRLAVSEACSNVVEHADDSDEYEVRVEVEDDLCEIRIIDAGRGFDAAALLDVMPPSSAPRGRGLAIMRAVMDATSFESHPESGAVVVLTKRLDLTAESPMRSSLKD
jgi:serine/threonine-protein kinase RsbW